MKKQLNVYIILLLLAFTSQFACKTTNTLQVQDQKLANALLWKVEGNELTNPSYVYGTIHMIDSEDYFLPEGFLSSFEVAKKVYFEVDINEMQDMGKVMGMMDKIMMKDDKSLGDLISKEDYAVVKAHFDEIGMPLMMLERMKPMFLEAFAISDMNPNDLKTGKLKSYEFELNSLAQDANKPIAGLESIEFQLGIFDSIPYEYQAERLVEAIKLGDESKGSLDQLVQIYKSMDIEAMVAMMDDEEGGIKGFEDLLLNKRNKNWIPIMEKAMRMESSFFAVGAGHLAGSNGVLKLLKAKGYKVSPVNPAK